MVRSVSGTEGPPDGTIGGRSLHHGSTLLDPEPGAVRRARSFVAEMLDLWQCDDPDQVSSLLTSEVVTNAVRRATRAIELEVDLDPQCTLTVSVTDDHPGLPVMNEPPLLGTGGRGLPLVASLARRWGVRTQDSSKAVWFEMAVHRREGSA